MSLSNEPIQSKRRDSKSFWKFWLVAAFVLAAAPCLTRGDSDSPTNSKTASSSGATQPSDADVLLNLFRKKGIISDQDVQDAHDALAARTNTFVPPQNSFFKISDAIKNIQIFGDVRLRYEYRGVDNIPGSASDTFYRERMRYALRLGVRGDLADDFNYGIRLESATNPRSPWDTFGNNTTAGSITPSDKNTSGVYIGQLYLGWHPTDWFEMSAGRMPMPIYTTPLVWDSDISPEGVFEKFKFRAGRADMFVEFAQFDYQDPSSANQLPSGDAFIIASQIGADIRLTTNTSFKIAPIFYNYTGVGASGNGLNLPFVGQGNAAGVNAGVPGATAANLAAYNENGINDLSILEIPAEYNIIFNTTTFGLLQARAFGDFAYNFSGDSRAKAAFDANPAAFPGMTGAATGENKAYQVGVGIGSSPGLYGPTQGLVYGSYAKKHAWEARAYWQHVEQYALDVNLLDSDFFEGRGNLQGVYLAAAYSLTDAIIATARYGYAEQIRGDLGTGGNNLDIPGINPVKYYNLLQMDLTWRF
jgi:hypothetical protein